ncbi:DUF6291 domain-containing protein [Flavobacterium coralii]|uniref:DUF6291 domain-containing protein n=1 Tax=Flavobacterium coralii TaxID=2838017 RepID=UPI000C4B24C4|nr:hypothetical protein [Flavobacterium sp.]|tara:strand:- start:31771 stop:32505 length:735 start_codon:yes stop_codon:yes gene_type:complete
MADNKKSFVAYTDWGNIFNMLNDDEAGKLAKHLFSFVSGETNELESRMLKIVFEPIRSTIIRDLEKYEQVKERRAEAGRKGGIKSGVSRKQNEANEANASFDKQNKANEAVNDTDTGNGNVNDTGNGNSKSKVDIESRKLKFASTLQEFNNTYPRSMLKEFYEYWTEENKSKSKFRQELEKTWNLKRRLETWARNDKNFSDGKSISNSSGTNTSQGYKPATVNTEKLIRDLTSDIENGNIPGQY